MMSIDQTILAKRLRGARVNTQLTQEAVAEVGDASPGNHAN